MTLNLRREISPMKVVLAPKLASQAVAEAERLLDRQAASVIDKPEPAPSGELRDFYSIGRYSWPNPDTADGLPWIRRDCDVNEASYGPRFDLLRYKTTVDSVVTLTVAHLHTGREDFAEAAVRHLVRWYLDPATSMRPNLNHAAALPGVHDGAWYGLIQGAVMTPVPFAAAALAQSKAWTNDRDLALRGWFGQFADWLESSPSGVRQATQGKNNNTMVWYHAQRAVFWHYAGDWPMARSALESVVECLATQIAPGCTFPAEVRRPEGLLYSVYCLAGVATAASLGGAHSVDVWGFQTDDGRSVRGCLDYLVPFLRRDRLWPGGANSQDTEPPEQAVWVYSLAASAFGDHRYLEVAETVRTQAPPAALSMQVRHALFQLVPATGAQP